MLLLTSTSDKLQVVTSAGAAVDVHASFTDYNGTTVTPDRKNTLISTVATTDVVLSPGSGVQRNVKTLHIRNRDGALTVDVTVKHTDGTNVVELKKVTLAPNAELQYTDALGFLML